jgi:hypothetical protein
MHGTILASCVGMALCLVNTWSNSHDDILAVTRRVSFLFNVSGLKPRYRSWADVFVASRILERSSSYYSPQPE